MPKPRHLPKGAGRVFCSLCHATDAAKGDGSPIVLPCVPSCPSRREDFDPNKRLGHYEAEVYFRELRSSEEIECEAPDWATATAMLAEIAKRDLIDGGEILRTWEGSELTIYQYRG